MAESAETSADCDGKFRIIQGGETELLGDCDEGSDYTKKYQCFQK